MKETRSKEKDLLKCCIIKYSFKTKLPLSIEYCHMPYFYSPLCPPPCAAHTDTETHTIVKLNDYFQDFFRVSCLLGDKRKASPSYRKTQEGREIHLHSET